MNAPITLRDNRNPGKDWFFLDAVFLSHFAPLIGPFGISVYAFMAGKVFGRPDLRISAQEIAMGTGMSKASAARAITVLVAQGMLVVVDQGSSTRAPSYALTDLKAVIEDKKCVSHRDASPTETHASPTETLNKEVNINKITTPKFAPLTPGADRASPKQPTRREAVRKAIHEAQQAALGVTVWAPAADKRLVAMLRDYPDPEWTTERLLTCVQSRFASDTDPAAPPQEWVYDLPRYISGAKDRFKLVDKSKIPKNAVGETSKLRRFQQAARDLEQESPEASRLPEALALSIKARAKEILGNTAFDSWIKPLIFSFVNDKKRVVILAPSMEWDGIQEKYSKEIEKSLGINGLTGGFDLWLMCKNGEWSQSNMAV